jgi:serine protease inhibitor
MKRFFLACGAGLVLVINLAVILTVIGLAPAPGKGENGGAAPIGAKDIERASESNNLFALKLYAALGAGKGNVVVCPFGVSMALGMVAAGARGKTAEELMSTAFAGATKDSLHPGLAGLRDDLTSRAAKAGELIIANRLWAQKGYEFTPEFRGLMEKFYGAGIAQTDFAAAEAARAEINKWGEGATKGKIKETIPAGGLTAQTRLVLADAVYFLGKWDKPFDQKKTRDRDFHLSAKETASVPTMYQEQRFRTASGPGVRLLELPYAGNDMALVILLPTEIDGLPKLEKSLALASLHNWLAALKPQYLDVEMPKFKITSQLDLGATLKSIGLKQTMSPAADLSGMTGKRDLFLSAAIQQAFIEIAETGTEAGAVTAMAVAADGNPHFTVDHPFLFILRDTKTGTILFMGRVVDPRG